MKDRQDIGPEFSRIVAVDRMEAVETLEIVADGAERAALGRRFGLDSLDALTASVTLTKFGDGRRVRLSANFSADVLQSCVVTLEPARSRIEDSFVLVYDEDAGGPAEAETVVLLKGQISPEPWSGDVIDVGEAVAEHLALALDPYPRATGADLSALGLAPGGADAGKEGDDPDGEFSGSPFKELAKLRRKT
ncbi:MAG: DUF177 domain-containing protein [Alphaproteobacteria bacterium]